MTFEAVLVSTLFLANLTVPSEALEAFRLHLVGKMLDGSDFGFRHFGGLLGDAVKNKDIGVRYSGFEEG